MEWTCSPVLSDHRLTVENGNEGLRKHKDIISSEKSCKPIIDQHFQSLILDQNLHLSLQTYWSTLSSDRPPQYNINYTDCTIVAWWGTHYWVNTFLPLIFIISLILFYDRKIWLFHNENPHRILQDLWRCSKICQRSLRTGIFHKSLKDPPERSFNLQRS